MRAYLINLLRNTKTFSWIEKNVDLYKLPDLKSLTAQTCKNYDREEIDNFCQQSISDNAKEANHHDYFI